MEEGGSKGRETSRQAIKGKRRCGFKAGHYDLIHSFDFSLIHTFQFVDFEMRGPLLLFFALNPMCDP